MGAGVGTAALWDGTAERSGPEVPHAYIARSPAGDEALSLSAQGAFRMRGILRGQSIHLFIIPEVRELMKRELEAAKYTRAPADEHRTVLTEVLYHCSCLCRRVGGTSHVPPPAALSSGSPWPCVPYCFWWRAPFALASHRNGWPVSAAQWAPQWPREWSGRPGDRDAAQVSSGADIPPRPTSVPSSPYSNGPKQT